MPVPRRVGTRLTSVSLSTDCDYGSDDIAGIDVSPFGLLLGLCGKEWSMWQFSRTFGAGDCKLCYFLCHCFCHTHFGLTANCATCKSFSPQYILLDCTNCATCVRVLPYIFLLDCKLCYSCESFAKQFLLDCHCDYMYLIVWVLPYRFYWTKTVLTWVLPYSFCWNAPVQLLVWLERSIHGLNFQRSHSYHYKKINRPLNSYLHIIKKRPLAVGSKRPALRCFELICEQNLG